MLSGSIAYTKALTEYVAKQNADSLALQAQKNQPGTDIFTGLPFKDDERLSDADKETAFRAYIGCFCLCHRTIPYCIVHIR